MLKDARYLNHFIKGKSHNLLILDGIGDFFVLETFMSNELRQNLCRVYYASRVQHFISKIWQCLPNFPNLKDHVYLWNDWGTVFCWLRKRDLRAHHRFMNYNPKIDLSVLREYVWATLFPMYQRKFCTQSSFLKYNVADISNFSILSKDYYCICPSSPYNRKWNNQAHAFSRMLNNAEWNALINFLHKRNSYGVVVNIGNDVVPKHPLIINLTNKTTLCESIEILKSSKGYVGVDSCLSVLAARLFKQPNLYIKSNNNHCYNWKHVYYHPHTNFNFLRKNLSGI